MQPVCLCIIIVLGFTALWLILEGSNKRPINLEYYFSGGTATDPGTTMAGSGVAGPLPQYASDMIHPPATLMPTRVYQMYDKTNRFRLDPPKKILTRRHDLLYSLNS